MITNAVYIYDEDIKKWNFTSVLNLEDDISGIYIMINNSLNQVYIGASTDIKKRMISHLTTPDYRSDKMKDLIKSYETKIFIPEYTKGHRYLSTDEESEFYSIFEAKHDYIVTNLKKLCFKYEEYDSNRLDIVNKIISLSKDDLFDKFNEVSNKFNSKRDRVCVYNDTRIINSDTGEYKLTKSNDVYAEMITVVLDDERMKFLIELSDFFEVNPIDCLKSHIVGIYNFIDDFKTYFSNNVKSEKCENGVPITFNLTYIDYYKLNKLFELFPEFKKSYSTLFNCVLEFFMNSYDYKS